MRSNARRLDRGNGPEPGLTLSFEDPADFLEVITPARVRHLQEIDRRAVAIFALAAALAHDPSAVGRHVALLESKHLVRKIKGPARKPSASTASKPLAPNNTRQRARSNPEVSRSPGSVLSGTLFAARPSPIRPFAPTGSKGLAAFTASPHEGHNAWRR